MARTALDREDPAADLPLRYFASRHGVPEDTATESAMRGLATCGMKRGLGDGLHGSAFSGELRIRIRGGLTWIGGLAPCASECWAYVA